MLTAEQFHDKKSHNDIAGQDAAHHGSDPGETLNAVRRFLAAKATVELPPSVTVCGHSVIVDRRARFSAALPALVVAADIEADEIRSFEFVPQWIARGEPWQASTPR